MNTFLLIAALCRLAALALVMFYSARYRDWLGMSIGILWAIALCFSTFTDLRIVGQIIATPLVYLVAWGIIKRQRGQK